MIEISTELLTIIMIGGILLGVLTGFHLGIVIASIGLIVGYLVFGSLVFELLYSRFFDLINHYVLAAIPMFIFMGLMLERSGIADRMYEALYLWLGGFRGGLAIITVLIGTIMATCVGIIAASIAMLTLIGLPSMIKRGYSKSLAAGSICAGGTLGILIPPSIMLVMYGPMAMISVGKLFMGAFGPGFILSGLYCAYITIRCLIQPNIAPVVPVEERAVPFIKKTTMLLISLVPVSLLILSVLGVIFFGIAPPTEAAGMGAFVSILLVIAYRRFNLQVLKEASLQTLKLTSMITIIAGMCVAFVGVFISAGCGKVVEDVILSAPGGRWGAFVVVMLIIFILGMFIDWMGIIFIMIPIISPVVPALGFNPVWFAIMICVNLQMGFMTPPFAPAIFFFRGTADPKLGVTMGDIIRGVIPFVILIMVGLTLCVFFPQIVLWLPSMMVR
ncbi:MAG: TRAP transporter large permease subunit [Dehalococcoidia bacterium]|nr:MAG: TRAP transporter large permease subunit [Dehalococcoidia bacterium]